MYELKKGWLGKQNIMYRKHYLSNTYKSRDITPSQASCFTTLHYSTVFNNPSLSLQVLIAHLLLQQARNYKTQENGESSYSCIFIIPRLTFTVAKH